MQEKEYFYNPDTTIVEIAHTLILPGKKEKAITSYVQAIRHTKDSIERIDASLKIKYLLP